MAFNDILVTLTSYPEPTPVSVGRGCGFGRRGSRCSYYGALLRSARSGARPLHFRLSGRPARDHCRRSRQEPKKRQGFACAFESAAAKSGVSREFIFQKCKSFEVPELLCEYARLRDLTIMPESNDRWYSEAVIFGSGRPVLILPQRPRSRPSSSGLSRWLGISAVRRLARYRMRYRCWKRRSKVRVVTVLNEKHIDRKHSAEELSKNLSRHGIDVVLDRIDAKGRSIGDVLGDYVASHASDMLVMGAYGHSRLREFVLGGATKSLLSKPPLPILFSH